MLATAVPLIAEEGPGTEPRRGPVAIHDEHLLAQLRFTQTALSPDTLGRGRWSIATAFLWSNSFSWTQDEIGETPFDRRFLIDGETRTLDLSLARGLTDAVDVGLRLPFRWRGGGVLDGLIETWHRIGGFPNNSRQRFARDALRVLGRTPDGRPAGWAGEAGAGLGRVELDARFSPWRGGGWRAGLVGRMALPTGGGAYSAAGLDAGLQAVAARALGTRFDFYLGAGAAFFGQRSLEGIEYARARTSGYLVVEWRPGGRISLLAELSAASRLVTGLAAYDGAATYLRLGAKWDLSPRLALEGGFSENLLGQQVTTDFGVFLGLARRFGQ